MDSDVNVAVSGALQGLGDGFAEYLGGLGYAPTSIGLRLSLMRHFSRWLAGQSVSPAVCDSAVLEQYLRVRQATHVDMSTPGRMAPLVAYLRSINVIPEESAEAALELGPADVVLERWARFLAVERGLRVSTIRRYQGLSRAFLLSRLHDRTLDLEGLDARAVSEFVATQIPGMSAASAQMAITALRSLLRFLFSDGLVAERLDQVVLGRAGYRDSGLPRDLAPEQVESLIAAIDPASRIGKRDLAVVLLLVRLGLRAGEVASLCLDDIDWRSGTLRVLGKGGQVDLLPLPDDAGQALAAHLSAGRDAAALGRSLFFTVRAPIRPVTRKNIGGIVRQTAERAGLGPVGSHRLRHTAAASTINAGASLEEVGQLLRHRSLASTTIYAKVDLVRLVALARPWPDWQEEAL